MSRIIIIDTETTGLSPYQGNHRGVNLAAVEIIDDTITTATNGKRWNGYACYNPKWAVMLIEILRVYNNYVLTD